METQENWFFSVLGGCQEEAQRKINLPYIDRGQNEKQNQGFRTNRSTIIIIVQRLVEFQASDSF